MNSEKKEGWTNAKIKFDKIFAKLRVQTEKRQISTIKKTIGLVKEYWQALDETQTSYVKQLMNDGEQEDVKRLNNELAEMESDMDETIALAEKVMSQNKKEKTNNETEELWKQKNNMEVEKSKEKETYFRKNKGKIQRVNENVQQTVGTLLSKISVSKEKYEKLQTTLKDQLVSEWNETSECKVFQGIEIQKYDKFLKHFQRAIGVDEAVIEEFKIMDYTKRMDGKVKVFTCKGTKTGGKYGVYVVLKRPQEKEIDVSYAMYTYNAEFVGSSTTKPNQRLKTTLVEDLVTGKMMQPDRFLKKSDVDELVQNFIVTKALTAFAHYGVIPKVTYDEESTPRIEEIH